MLNIVAEKEAGRAFPCQTHRFQQTTTDTPQGYVFSKLSLRTGVEEKVSNP